MCKYCIALEIPRGKAALGEKGKFWPVGYELKIAFVGGSENQRSYVREHADEWLNWANLSFKWNVPVNESDIRIAFVNGNGAWSYVGTYATSIPKSRPTMNFGWLDQSVVLHEFGHALGLGHEHQNPEGGIQWNRDAVIAELSGPPNNWDIATIVFNVLDAYNANEIIGTTLDPNSIMMYPIPAEWTLNGFSTGFNDILSDLDKQFIKSLYPFETIHTDEALEAFKKVFLKKKDLSRLSEETVCRIGDLIGAGTDENRYYKRVNVDKVWAKIIL